MGIKMLRLVCLSDTHGHHYDITVPDGDILICAGDFCNHGRLEEVASFGRWLRQLPHPYKVVVAGNHDWPFERTPRDAREALIGDPRYNVQYLQDQETTILGLRIYGSPWQPEFMGWAFNLPRQGAELRAKWDNIPDGLDVLVTHGPPYDILDRSAFNRMGCELLARAVSRAAPRVHVFGHNHGAWGALTVGSTLHANVAICDDAYEPRRSPRLIDVSLQVSTPDDNSPAA